VNNELQGEASWTNLLTGRDRRTPAGWRGEAVADADDEPQNSMVEYEGPLTTPFHGPK
jgi:hypothetical protein